MKSNIYICFLLILGINSTISYAADDCVDDVNGVFTAVPIAFDTSYPFDPTAYGSCEYVLNTLEISCTEYSFTIVGVPIGQLVSAECPVSCNTCPGANCDDGEWTCSDGTCIATSEICDGNNDCSDNADEAESLCGDSDDCASGEFACDGGCIATSKLCDGVNDCTDSIDEASCGTGNVTEDTTPPVLESVAFTPDAVDVTAGSETITFTIDYSDEISGVFRVYLSVVSPSGGQGENKYFWPEAGDTQITYDMEIAQFSESGDWVINNLTLLDNVGNSDSYHANNMYGNWNSAWPTTFNVTSVQDITAPTLTSVSIDPSSLNVTAGPDTITFTIGHSDDLSGVYSGYIHVQSPASGQYFDKWFNPANDGDTQSIFDLEIPQYAESGNWVIYSIRLQDNAGNTKYYYEAEADYPAASTTTFNVTSDDEDIAAPTITSISFTPSVLHVMTGPDTMTVTIGHADDISGVYRGRLQVQSPIYNQIVEKWFWPEAGDTQTTFDMEIPQYAESGDWVINSVRLDDNVGNYDHYYPTEEADWNSTWPTTFKVDYGDSCPIGQFTCLDGDCIETSLICNGTNDCSDGGDEAESFCGASDDCTSGEIACDGGCIATSKICDGVDDCADGIDETGCGVSTEDIDLTDITTPLDCMAGCDDYDTIISETTNIDFCTWLMASYADACISGCLGNDANQQILAYATTFCTACITLDNTLQGGCDMAMNMGSCELYDSDQECNSNPEYCEWDDSTCSAVCANGEFTCYDGSCIDPADGEICGDDEGTPECLQTCSSDLDEDSTKEETCNVLGSLDISTCNCTADELSEIECLSYICGGLQYMEVDEIDAMDFSLTCMAGCADHYTNCEFDVADYEADCEAIACLSATDCMATCTSGETLHFDEEAFFCSAPASCEEFFFDDGGPPGGDCLDSSNCQNDAGQNINAFGPDAPSYEFCTWITSLDPTCYNGCDQMDIDEINEFVTDCSDCMDVDNDGECDYDCFGIKNGTAWESDCGCVAVDNSGNDCDDCAGVPNGDLIEDCKGACGGPAVLDNDDFCCDSSDDMDCNDICNGDAVKDVCGNCQGDCTGTDGVDVTCSDDSNNIVTPDCNFTCGGPGELDGNDNCYASGELDGNDNCCDPGAVVDGADVCCDSGTIDVCGVCDGDATSDTGCFVELSIGSVANGSMEIILHNTVPIVGFQFELTGVSLATNACSGGSAGDASYLVSNGVSTIIGYSLSLEPLPVGNTVLTNIAYTATNAEACIKNNLPVLDDWASSFGNANGEYKTGDCVALDCGEGNDADCCGVCGGDGSTCTDDGCDCGVLQDCNNVCGGPGKLDGADVCCPTGAVDDCGVCDGTYLQTNGAYCGGTGDETDNCCDCAGNPNGDNVLNCCGTCGVPPGPLDDDPCDVCGNCNGDCIGLDGINASCGESENNIVTPDCDFLCGGTNVAAAGEDCDGNPLSIDGNVIPEYYNIHNIYPNPFNPVTNISYGLPENTNVKIEIYDLTGRQVCSLINEFQHQGNHSINWNASAQSTGIYFVKMIAGDYVNTKKLMLIK